MDWFRHKQACRRIRSWRSSPAAAEFTARARREASEAPHDDDPRLSDPQERKRLIVEAALDLGMVWPEEGQG
jgi:hypothetical protein